MNAQSKIRGFSLIELLVVILILSLLAGLLLPALAKARRRARDAKCLSNLHQLYVAYQAYLNDFPDGLFAMGLGDVNMGGHPEELLDERPDFVGDWTGLWMGAMEPYVLNKKIYECPMADTRYVNTFNRQTIGYGLNISFNPKPTPTEDRLKAVKLEQKHSDHPLFADSPFFKTSYLGHDLLAMGFANASNLWIQHLLYRPTDKDKRHPGGSNMVFHDGHTETLDFRAVWTRLNFLKYDQPPNGYRF